MRENRKNIAAGAAFVALIVGFLILISAITTTSDSQETQLVYDAVKNAALTCYAVEGAYPDSVDYLREHYRLAYDEDRYMITYDAFASNMIPDIWVTERGAQP